MDRYEFSKPYRTGPANVYPPMPEPETSSEGMKKAVASGAMSGAAAIPGQLGDIQQLTNAVPSIFGDLALSAYDKARKFFNRPDTPEYLNAVQEAKRALDESAKFGAKIREYNLPNLVLQNLPQEARDWVKKTTGLEKIYAPTTEEISAAVDPYAVEKFGVGPKYEPLSKEEKIAKEATSFGTQAIAGPGKLIPRLVTGTAAGAGSEIGRQQAEGTALEMPAQIAGSIVGGVAPTALQKTAKSVLNPTQVAKETLGDVGKSYSVGSAKPIQTMAGMNIQEIAESIPQRFKDFSKRLTGVQQDLPPLQQLVDDAALAERKRVYDLARSHPQAQSIDNMLFADLMERPEFKKAMAEAMTVGENAPHFGIVAPTPDKGGNLAYWDQVKRILSEKSSNAFQSSAERSATKGNYLKSMQDELTDLLDKTVDAYPKARDIASNTFNASNAAIAGMQFMNNIDVFEREAVKNAIKQYSPAQKQLFNVGVMQTLTDAIEKGNLENISKKFLKDNIFQDKLKSAMGDEQFSVLRGKILSENMLNKAWQMQQSAGVKSARSSISSPLAKGALASAATGAAFEGQMILNTLSQLNVSPTTAAAMVGSLIVAGGGQAIKNAQDRRVVGRMIDLIQKNDPKSFREIDALTRKHPDLYQAVIGPLTATDIEGSREGRATGGRIGVGSIAQRLVASAEKAHKYHQKTTEEILDAPDEAVVKALAVAKKHI